MKRYWSGLVAAGAMAATVGLGAQAQGQNPAKPADTPAQPGSQQRTQAPAAPDARAQNTITVTGCLQSAPATTADARGAAAGEARSSASAATTSGFVLNGVTPAAGGAGRGAVGTTGAAAASYKLEGDTSMLKPHLNHRVQITGRLQGSSASATGAANAAPGSTAAGPTLRVENVTMLSSTCDTAATTPQNQRNQSQPSNPPGGGEREPQGEQRPDEPER